MDAKEFIGITLWLVGGLATLIIGLAGIIYYAMTRRLDQTEIEKADRHELDVLSAEVKALSREHKEVNNKTGQILVQIATITQQVARMVSDIDSEKRTRAESQRELKEEIRRSRDDVVTTVTRMMSYGRRKDDQPDDDRR